MLLLLYPQITCTCLKTSERGSRDLLSWLSDLKRKRNMKTDFQISWKEHLWCLVQGGELVLRTMTEDILWYKEASHSWQFYCTWQCSLSNQKICRTSSQIQCSTFWSKLPPKSNVLLSDPCCNNAPQLLTWQYGLLPHHVDVRPIGILISNCFPMLCTTVIKEYDDCDYDSDYKYGDDFITGDAL